MKKFCFTVDDNIRCLKEITESDYGSIFEHPYLRMYKRLHEKYGLKVQLNLFYEMKDFCLLDMTDRYIEEWSAASDWLKLSFHSRIENVRPYKDSGYDEVFTDCRNVQKEILRFATGASLGKTTTVYYCLATEEGLRALKDITASRGCSDCTAVSACLTKAPRKKAVLYAVARPFFPTVWRTRVLTLF